MTLDPEWAARRRAIERSRYWVGRNGRRGRLHRVITGKVLAHGGLGLRNRWSIRPRSPQRTRYVEMEIDMYWCACSHPGMSFTLCGIGFSSLFVGCVLVLHATGGHRRLPHVFKTRLQEQQLRVKGEADATYPKARAPDGRGLLG